ncbi:porin [Sulfuriroseicoccus oceanibius]|uniref:Phosphate-selective porin O and P n=1 Tax=Sulfuriroseicoccus oceanibius TaxID=2707525 RepID=A0A6B3LCA8_9BACT|nr:hypothetical protein [Sulfuriroseicoccus oceanibius]QQL45923.1 hypothetical protein G3M56_004910 [Sulfuriroseicoccus oceanibius]
MKSIVPLTIAALSLPCISHADLEADALREKIDRLQAELAAAQGQLAQMEGGDAAPVVPAAEPAKDVTVADAQEDDSWRSKLDLGGGIAVNYILGSYTRDGGRGPERGGNGGNFEFSTFRLNFDYNAEGAGFTGSGEYRFMDGYHFPRKFWFGWRGADESLLRVGHTLVPFGEGEWGPSKNWFYDGSYYVGLADDADIGVAYQFARGPWTIDLGYFLMAEPSGFGDSTDSARFGADIVDNGSPYAHYEERNQVNLRVVRKLDLGKETTLDLGGSFQAGMLIADDRFAEDSYQLATALHAKWKRGPWEIVGQATAWDYAADYHSSTGLSNDLIGMGAYDFEDPVASRAFLPSVSFAYIVEPKNIDWLDEITFYNDFSVMMKSGSDEFGNALRNSAMNTVGASLAIGDWFIFCDWVYSNGNYVVGNDPVTDFGANLNQTWQSRFNVNIGYSF